MVFLLSNCTPANRTYNNSKGFFYDRIIAKKPFNFYQDKRILNGNVEQQEFLLKKRERQSLWDSHLAGSLNHQKPQPNWVTPTDGSY